MYNVPNKAGKKIYNNVNIDNERSNEYNIKLRNIIA